MANIGKVVVSALCVSLLFAGVAGVKELKEAFETNPPKVIESAKLTFKGVDEGYDVYNCSIPFAWGGTEYIFGRVEPHDKWASSVTMLFRKTGKDEWTRVLEFGKLELEDPYIQYIRGELIVGGTRVMKVSGKVATYRGAFYRDNKKGPMHLEYFTTGPERMKDIRLVELKDGRIGVFSRPRGEDVRKKYGSESVIGFTTVKDLDELDREGAGDRGRVRQGRMGRMQPGVPYGRRQGPRGGTSVFFRSEGFKRTQPRRLLQRVLPLRPCDAQGYAHPHRRYANDVPGAGSESPAPRRLRVHFWIRVQRRRDLRRVHRTVRLRGRPRPPEFQGRQMRRG